MNHFKCNRGSIVPIVAAILAFLALFTFMVWVSGYERIQPATVGKILAPSGFQEEVLEPGRVWVPPFRKLIILDTSTVRKDEQVTVILDDKISVPFDVRFRMRLSDNPDVINRMFDDIRIGDSKTIDIDRVYDIYGQMIIENKAREIASKYDVDELHVNYDKLSDQIAAAVQPELKNTPLEMSQILVANMELPGVVTDAVEQAKQRELEIQKEKAQNEIELLRKQNERKLAEAEYETRMTKARTIRDESRTIAEGVSPELIEFRRLEIQEIFANHAASGNFTFMPIEAISSIGGQVRMFNQDQRSSQGN